MALTSGAGAGGMEFSRRTRLLVVAPHPDDETLATGVLVQQVLAAGGEVRILLLTAGGNNPWPQRALERRWRIGAQDRQRWARRRADELQQALATLGLPPAALQSLDWPDLGVTDVLTADHAAAAAAVRDVIDLFRPTVIAVPSLQDRHPDHGAAHVLVRLALAGRPEPPKLLGYLVHGRVEGLRWRVPAATPAQMSVKREALSAHRSQLALSSKRLRRLAERPEAFFEPGNTGGPAATALPWRPPRWLWPWLRLDLVGPARACHWSWRTAPLQRDKTGGWRLLPRVAMGPGPCFVKLSLDLRSPWIFDHWGWCRWRADGEPSGAGIAPPDRPS